MPAAGILSPQLACRQPRGNYSELKGGSNRSLPAKPECVGSVLACGPIGRGFESLLELTGTFFNIFSKFDTK